MNSNETHQSASLVLCDDNPSLQTPCGILFAWDQCLTSAASQAPPPAGHLQPLLQLPSAAPPLAADALFHSLTPTSNHVRSCILHLQHHIRPVLFLLTTLIYIPPPCPSPPAASSSFLPCVFGCLGHSQHLKKAPSSPGLCASVAGFVLYKPLN